MRWMCRQPQRREAVLEASTAKDYAWPETLVQVTAKEARFVRILAQRVETFQSLSSLIIEHVNPAFVRQVVKEGTHAEE